VNGLASDRPGPQQNSQAGRVVAKFLVTGAAGFIGFHTSQRLLARGDSVVGLDNLNDYYSVALKRDRLQKILPQPGFTFHQFELADREAVAQLFARESFDVVIHLAAQAGVRYSIENPHAYVASNLIGFVNILEGCRHSGGENTSGSANRSVKHLVYASSSSVYGANKKMPFAVHDSVDHPVSLYAATKKSNELMAHVYSHLYGLPTTGLRFFTVYGPWGRPDMALWLFTKAILAGQSINVFNHGQMRRDFTYIDDIVEGVVRVADRIPAADPNWSPTAPDPASSFAPFRVYNIGNNTPVELMRLIAVLEQALGRKAELNFLPMQPGDVPETYADIEALTRDVGFRPSTPIETGVEQFVRWYRDYHGV
jgi:UDP-glucuronate 4-epimerase